MHDLFISREGSGRKITSLKASLKTLALFITLGFYLLEFPLSADVLLETFSTNQEYPSCCGEVGAYDSFIGNLEQHGTNALLRIGGGAIDRGGFYHDGFGQPLWDLSGQTNLTLLIRAMDGNEAHGLQVVLRDVFDRLWLYDFRLSGINTNEIMAFTVGLAEPVWTSHPSFDFSAISSIDVMGDYSDCGLPLRLEMHGITVSGPLLVRQSIRFVWGTTNLTLYWPTNYTTGYVLQSAEHIMGPWVDVNGEATLIGQEYSLTFSVIEGTRFFRLSSVSNPEGEDLIEQSRTQTTLMGRGLGEILEDGSQVPPPAFLQWLFKTDPPPPPIPGTPGTTEMESMEPHPLGEAAVPPSTNLPPSQYESFVDIGSYAGQSYHWTFQAAGSTVVDIERRYTLNFNDHTTSASEFIEKCWGLHTRAANPPYPWLRSSSNYSELHYNQTWDRLGTNWPNGTLYITYITNSSTNITGPQIVGRPTIPIGKISFMGYTNTVGDTNSSGAHVESWRTDAVTLHLHVGTPVSNLWYRWVLLSTGVTNVDSVGTRAVGNITTDGSLAFAWTGPVLSFSNLTLLGEPLNADYKVFKQMWARSNLVISPGVSESSNFLYDVKVESHKIVNLNRSYHPLFEKPPVTNAVPSLTNLQALFNGGSKLLATDDDARIIDTDPSAAYSDDVTSVYRNDDVPVYLEFRISNASLRTNCYAPRLYTPTFPTNYATSAYFNIMRDSDVLALQDGTFANVKIVNSGVYRGEPFGGIGRTGVMPSRIILTYNLNSQLCIHEWGHTCGCYHRNEFANGITNNPGLQTNAIMTTNILSGQNDINRAERALMLQYHD